MRDGDPPEDLERLVVQHLAAVAEQPAVAVVRVLAEADVGHDDELGRRLLERADRLLDDAVLGEALEPERVLRARDPEQEHGLDPEGAERPCFAHDPVHRQLVDPGHRVDRFANAVTRDDEERVHEVVGRECRLAHEVPERSGAPKAAWTPCSRVCAKRVERLRVGHACQKRPQLSPKCDMSA